MNPTTHLINCNLVTQKVTVIKIVRALTRLGLKEAKDLVEDTMPGHGNENGWSALVIMESDPSKKNQGILDLKREGVTFKSLDISIDQEKRSAAMEELWDSLTTSVDSRDLKLIRSVLQALEENSF